jgi:hypothetical protein
MASDVHEPTLAAAGSNGRPGPLPRNGPSTCQVTGFVGQNFGWLTGHIGHWQTFVLRWRRHTARRACDPPRILQTARLVLS